jgi:N-acetylglucosamine-6-phosphate deacetylase
MDVDVTGGTARLVRGGSIAGSTLTMDAAVRRAVRVLGVPMVDAARAAATTPARVLGLERDVGALAPGLRADLVVLGDELAVAAVMRRGIWFAPA